MSAPPSSRGQFQCTTCSQTYSRVDHLARHVRSHTQEKPYRCETCNKRFSRGDLLRRHSLVHTAPTDENKRRRTSHNSSVLRASRACEACAEHHLKCEDEKPCRRCVKRNISCVVVPRNFIHENQISPTKEPSPQKDVDGAAQLESDSTAYAANNTYTFISSEPATNQVPLHQPMPADMPEVMDCLPTGLYPTGFPSGAITPVGLVGFGVETDLDFSAMDLSFLGTYNTQVPFEIESFISQDATQSVAPVFENASHVVNNEESNVLNNKFRNQSIWRFSPAPGVHAYTDQANLSLPDQDQIVRSRKSFADVGRRIITEKLDFPTRDKMLAIVLSEVKPHILPAISAFPSVELLDNLIQFFLAGPIPTAGAWFHTPSFRPTQARPELLLAMAAAGAVLTPDRALRKLGFAIQEVNRCHIPTVFEADNTTVRDLEMQQAFMLQLEIGLWSGNGRRIEIAESFLQPLLSMLRRGGRFRRSYYPLVSVAADEEGQSLDKKWRTWIEQESSKRLVFHIMGHDARSSMSLLVSPLVSYAELGLPLPESQELWIASSAQEWKALYTAKFDHKSIRLPCLTECIANLDLLESSKDTIDLSLSCSSFLYAIWGLVWEYRKLGLLFHGNTHVWDSGLAMMTRYQELIKMFEYYRINYGNKDTLLLEMILMHLHMPLEDIQLFAGLEGAEEADRVRNSVKEWASSKTCRQAMWHAAQVVRSAKELPPLQLRDFNAISLYHAGLAFWVYGLASQMFFHDRTSTKAAQGMQPPTTPQQMTWIDGEECTKTYHYISLNRGTPALQGVRSGMPPAMLNDPKATMEVIIETMKRADGETVRPNSPLVENLLKMMERLRDSRIGENGIVV